MMDENYEMVCVKAYTAQECIKKVEEKYPDYKILFAKEIIDLK